MPQFNFGLNDGLMDSAQGFGARVPDAMLVLMVQKEILLVSLGYVGARCVAPWKTLSP